jgi:hypothetical protein
MPPPPPPPQKKKQRRDLRLVCSSLPMCRPYITTQPRKKLPPPPPGYVGHGLGWNSAKMRDSASFSYEMEQMGEGSSFLPSIPSPKSNQVACLGFSWTLLPARTALRIFNTLLFFLASGWWRLWHRGVFKPEEKGDQLKKGRLHTVGLGVVDVEMSVLKGTHAMRICECVRGGVVSFFYCNIEI